VGVQLEHAGAREQGRVHRERGVLGGGADQRDRAALHVGQERVLLPLVEAVDLVDEQRGAALVEALLLGGPVEDLAQLRHAPEHGAERHEGGPRLGRHHLGERGLARARRPPQQHGGHAVLAYRRVQDLAGRDQVLLAQHLVERAGPHAVGEGRALGRGALSVLEQVHRTLIAELGGAGQGAVPARVATGAQGVAARCDSTRSRRRCSVKNGSLRA
jgi:hypothetical protein